MLYTCEGFSRLPLHRSTCGQLCCHKVLISTLRDGVIFSPIQVKDKYFPHLGNIVKRVLSLRGSELHVGQVTEALLSFYLPVGTTELYDPTDCEWFMRSANQQSAWGTVLQHDTSVDCTEDTSCLSFNTFKKFLLRILHQTGKPIQGKKNVESSSMGLNPLGMYSEEVIN